MLDRAGADAIIVTAQLMVHADTWAIFYMSADTIIDFAVCKLSAATGYLWIMN